ncbi:hypothetical protein [Streptomyces sp. HM190]|uniref:hypothetical protein n=1 Tax=Streptomyces sp. HM190 TaxID=2695266 RepID=UPI00135AD77A|nr:hypothetical protein [Streptomyces sp. HM190]
MFTLLADLEKLFRDSAADRPRSVEKLLSRLNAVVRPLFTEPVMEAISRASMLTVLSNIPLGLATMLGDIAPLAARLPLRYEPLLPLTRTVKKAGAVAVGVEWPRLDGLTAGCGIDINACLAGAMSGSSSRRPVL